MAKFVEFNGEIIGIPDKSFKIIDSSKNVKKTAKHYQTLISKFSTGDDDDDIAELVGNQPMMTEEIANKIADIADLTAKEKANLADQSYSDQYAIFNDFLTKFLGIKLPSLDDDDETESEAETDPKLPEED
ncbi:hypothetical protein [Loigolactobacillus jiayinensis]|uniref:Phage portal protein n=1 Tax=Loigolactobacillus jiayinensis TaxID=2486016 RepID=A0ABW1RF18_9LACO|nr:hypothetical protein [Loigolactobacillus jiayinensis]